MHKTSMITAYPSRLLLAQKVMTGMDSSGIDQVIHPQITDMGPIGHSTDVLPSSPGSDPWWDRVDA
jgi:hypothetical protein